MDFLKEWVTNIILFILLATIIDMLLPSSNMQKYTKMVTGLLLIAIILTPIFKLISSDFETAMASFPSSFQDSGEKNVENLIEIKKKEIQASNDAYILETMAVQLEQGVEEELMEQFGLEIVKINLTTNDSEQSFPENLQMVTVLLKKSDEQAKTVEAIQPVSISTEKPLPAKETAEDSKKIAAFLAEKWDVTGKTIEVTVEGGNEK